MYVVWIYVQNIYINIHIDTCVYLHMDTNFMSAEGINTLSC